MATPVTFKYFFSKHYLCKKKIRHIIPIDMIKKKSLIFRGPSWSWSYGSWIYNYLCNPYLSIQLPNGHSHDKGPVAQWVR